MTTAKKTAAKTAAAPEKAAPVFTFGDATVPEKTRESKVVNPMLEACKAILTTYSAEEKRSTLAKTVTAPNAETVKSIKRWLSEAGISLGYTFRSSVDDKNVVTFWAVEKITHRTPEQKAKDEAEKAAAKAAKAAEKTA